MNNQVINVEIANIVPNRFQPRLTFDNDSLKELAGSIKTYGIIEPIILRKFGEKYEIIAGERRCRSATLAGLSSVPAIIMDVDDKKAAELALIENIQRKELTAIEEAKAYKNILEMGGFSKEELANKIGKQIIVLENKIKLLNLDNSVQDALLNGAISEKHAKSLLQVSELDTQKEILNKIISERMSVKLTEEYIKSLEDNTINKKMEDTSNDIVNINDLNQISNALDELDIKEEKSDIFNDKTIKIEERENKNMNNENQMPNFNFGNNIMQNNSFPSLEDQTVNMNTQPIVEQPQVAPVEPTTPVMPTINVEQPVQDTFPNINQPTPEVSVPITPFNNNEIEEQPQVAITPTETVTPVMPEQPITEPTMPNINETFISDQPIENQNITPTIEPSPLVSTPEPTPFNGPIIPEFSNEPVIETPTPIVETQVTPTVETSPVVNIPEPTVTPEVAVSNEIPNIEMPVQESPAQSATNNAKLMEAVNGIRNIMPVLESKGFTVELEEKDLDGEYQMIIKLKK